MADTAPVAGGAAQTAAPQASTPAAAAPAVPANAAPVESAPPKVKVRKHRQRSCDEKDAKGKVCAGHLKRWYDYPADVAARIGPKSEIYRCEFCKTLYRPDPEQLPHSFTLRY